MNCRSRLANTSSGTRTPDGTTNGRLLPGAAIDPAADLSVRTLSTSNNLTVGGDLKVNGKALLGEIADLMATVKGLREEKLSTSGGTVSGGLSVGGMLTVDGNVGIGTTAPEQKLTVQGNHGVSKDPDSGLSYGGQMAIKGNACQLDFIDTDHNDWAILVNGSKMHFVRQPWTYTDLVLDANGNVGINTDAPNARLQVNGDVNVAGEIIRRVSIATALGPDDETNGGPIPSRTMTFTKRHANSAIRIIYCDNFRVVGNNVAARWEIRINGGIPPGGAIYQDKFGSSGNFHEPAMMMGYAQGIGAGTHTIAIWVGTPPGYPTCDALYRMG
jgi:hypothetical protein